MTKKHGPEEQKEWVHLTDQDGHLLDQTNGLAKLDDPVPHVDGVTDEERSAAAAFISGGFSGA